MWIISRQYLIAREFFLWKFINGINWSIPQVYSSKCIHIDELFSGYISLIKIDKVKQRITVDYEKSDVCLLDDGYKCLFFLPDDEKWYVSAVYNISNQKW